MNNLLRKITAGLLSATMILSGLGSFPTAMSDLFAYAGSGSGGGGDSTNRDESNSAVRIEGNGSSMHMKSTDWYVLDISTGIQSGDCVKNIIIHYKDNSTAKNEYKQVLNPTVTDYPDAYSKSVELIEGVPESSVSVLSLHSDPLDGSEFISYDGSRLSSFSAPIMGMNSGQLLTPPLLARLSGRGQYVSMGKEFTEKFKSVSEMMADAPFQSGSTDQIVFNMEHTMSELLDISFYCEATGNDSWDLRGWTLYSVSSFRNDYPKMRMSSGAFISNSLQLEYDGKFVASSNSDNLEEGLSFLNAGMFTFFHENKNPEYNSFSNPYTFNTNDVEVSSITQTGTSVSSSYTPGKTVSLGGATVLNFSINLMDSYGAGIDSFNMLPGSKMELREMLTAEIEYTDTSGFVKTIELPVFSNAILEYITDGKGEYNGREKMLSGDGMPIEVDSPIGKLGDTEKKIRLNNYLSFAQQGESIIFSVAFKDFASLNKMTLDYTNPVDDKDTMIVKDITVYDNWGQTGDARRENYTVKDTDASGKPVNISTEIRSARMLYRTKAVVGGTYFENIDSRKTFDFEAAGSSSEIPKDYSKTYLVQIHTSDVNFADTTDDVLVSFDYVDKSGKECQTQEYSLLERCHDFYGYNPGVDASGKVVDGSYNYCMRRGGTLKFFIDVQNMDHFTGMTVHLNEGGKDDWQMGSVDVSPVTAIGRRTVEPHLGSYGGVTITRIYDRDMPVMPVYSSDTRVYIQEGVTETVDFETGSYSSETERRDMSQYYYEMDYKTATSELHFDERAWKYQVVVNVQKNSVSGTVDDDCGSNNLFYFQLVFEKGKSAYVLANQQLQHDCFRSGQAEAFDITINENLGELVSINVIPDDSTVEAQRLDKLCIDTIEVIKSNPDSANKRYVCENVGWINSEYEDDAEDNSDEGRVEAEVVTAIPVDYSGYILSFEVALALDSYTSSENVTGEQFVGGMKVNIAYQTSSGEQKSTGDLDMVRLMYEYAGRMGVADDVYTTVSDPSFMFRPNKIDRFIVDISDAYQIISITFSGMPKAECKLPIAGVSIRLLQSEGGLVINDSGEFQRIYNVEPILLTDDIPGRKLPNNFDFVPGHYTPHTFKFNTNNVPELDDEQSANSIVPRQPLSCNDTLNLFVYMKDGVPTPQDGGYNVRAKISYSSVSTTNTFVNECSKLKTKHENGRVVLYAKGLSANNMSVLTNLKLSGEDKTENEKYTINPGSSTGIDVDYAIVQQVRNGVTINTYKIVFNSKDIFFMGGANMSTKIPANTLGYGQKVTLRLGEGTNNSKLVPEEYDIAVAIKYRSKAVGENDNTELKSAYVFASDMDILSIQEGSVVEFNFSEPYIDEITCVEVVAMNGLAVTVDAGNIACTVQDDKTGGISIEHWYSMGEKTVIGKSATELPITSTKADDYNSLKRVKFSFTTMEKSSVIDNGGTAPIRMAIGYRSTTDQNEEFVIDDIRDCAFGGFAAGEEATVDIFVSGLKSLNYVRITPYDEDPGTIASWNLESVSFSMEGGVDNSEHNIPIDRTFYEREDTLMEDGNISNYINLSTMKGSLMRSMDGTAASYDAPEQEISVAPGTSIDLDFAINGGNSDYYIYFVDREKVNGGAAERVISSTKTAAKFNLLFENSDTVAQLYRVTLFAVENPTVKIVLTVNVAPEKIEEAPVNTDVVIPGGNTEGGGTTENTNTGGGTNTGGNNGTDNTTTEPVNTTPGTTSEGGSVGSASNKTNRKKEEDTSLDA